MPERFTMKTPSEVIVAGKSQCGICDACKAKLKLLGEPYRFVDITDWNPAWRDLGLREAMVEHATKDIASPDGAHGPLPLLLVDGAWLEYAPAMKRIKDRRSAPAEAVACGAAGN